MNDNLINEFYSKNDIFRALGEEVVYILRRKTKSLGLPIANITYRVKTFESFIEKIRRKGYQQPFIQNTDFIGVRVVYIYKDDLYKLKNLLRNEFEIIEESHKSEQLNSDQFGYEACHFLLRLPRDYNGIRYEDIKHVICEVQVRSTLQDAWALVSHHLGYKKESDIPKVMQRKLFALAGAFETVDDQLVSIKTERLTYFNELKLKIDSNNLSEEINLDNFKEYLNRKFPEMRLETTMGAVNNFPKLLKKYGYNTLQDVEDLLNKTHKVRELFNSHETWGKSAAREVFIALGLVQKNSDIEFALAEDRYLLNQLRPMVRDE
jgi:ppGpp synthetase/RelA/SpoT-type nucleotidyltranferase